MKYQAIELLTLFTAMTSGFAMAQEVTPAQGRPSPTQSLGLILPVRGQAALVPEVLEIPPDLATALPVESRKSWPAEVPYLGEELDDTHSTVPVNLQPKAVWDQIYYDHNEDGIWSMGEAYKTLSHRGGFSYTPFLGSQAPHNYPVNFRLSSVILGGKQIELAKSADLTREGDRVILDRGAVQVWYDMSTGSVEQSFAVEAAGSTEDLVLNIAVETELQKLETNDGLAFRNELGGVDYRHAFVVDGAGKTMELSIESTEEGFRLTVPASYLAQAISPVVVDPVLSTYQIQPGIDRDQQAPDVAYDLTSNVFAYVHWSKIQRTPNFNT